MGQFLKHVLSVIFVPFSVFGRRSKIVAAIFCAMLQAIGITVFLIVVMTRLALPVWPVALFWVAASVLAVFEIVSSGTHDLDQKKPGEGSNSAVLHTTEVCAADAFDFNKEQYEELCSTQRHIGTMRARIAWAPATVAIAVVAFLYSDFIGENKEDELMLSVIILFILLIILLLIFISDSIMARRERILKNMCVACEDLLIGSAKVSSEDRGLRKISKFSDLRKYAKVGVGRIFVDKANGLLAFYFAFLFSIPFIAVLYPWLSRLLEKLF